MSMEICLNCKREYPKFEMSVYIANPKQKEIDGYMCASCSSEGVSLDKVDVIDSRSKFTETENSIEIHLDINDYKWLIGTVKQQNEQIKELQKDVKEWEEVDKAWSEVSNKAIDKKDQRIEELEQANARGNGHVKACEERIEELEKALEFYANGKNYETDVINQWEPITPILKDEGEKAKQALNK